LALEFALYRFIFICPSFENDIQRDRGSSLMGCPDTSSPRVR
jgi:hypothetical protein